MKKTVSVAICTPNPGRIYRPMYCPVCGDTRFHRVDFIEGERNIYGYFVWYASRCTGVEPVDTARKRKILRQPKDCGKETVGDMPLSQWLAFIKCYY